MSNIFLNPEESLPLLLLIVLWTLPWKGVALWRATQNRHKGWFVAILVLNTLAILEITYIFYFSKQKVQKTENPQGSKGFNR